MPPPPVDKQNQGQVLYRKGQYREALRVFTSIIDKWHDYPISVLDNRAATHIKLGDLTNALKDARSMISRERSQVSGYLRAGQILKKMSRYDTALDMYEYGLKHVSVEDARLLRDNLDSLRQEFSPPKTKDIVMLLPLELTQEILSYLSFRNIVTLLRVSKEWRASLQAMTRIWRQMDFSGARKPVGFGAIKANIERARGSLSHLTLFRVSSKADNSQVLATVIGRNKRLEYLHLRDNIHNDSLRTLLPSAKSLRTLIISSGTTIDCISAIIEHCPTLVCVEFHSVVASENKLPWLQLQRNRVLTRLQVLKLKWNSRSQLRVPHLNLNLVLPLLPNLEELEISNFGGQWDPDFLVLRKLKKLKFDHFKPFPPYRIPPSVKELDLGFCSNEDSDYDEAEEVNPPLALHHVSMYMMSSISSPVEPEIFVIQSMPTLETLCLRRWNVDQIITSMRSQQTLPSLRTITMQECNDLDDVGLETIASRCPKLVELNVSRCRYITGAGIKSIVSKPGESIERIDLTHCSNVSADTVEWARASGVQVVYRFPDAKGDRS